VSFFGDANREPELLGLCRNGQADDIAGHIFLFKSLLQRATIITSCVNAQRRQLPRPSWYNPYLLTRDSPGLKEGCLVWHFLVAWSSAEPVHSSIPLLESATILVILQGDSSKCIDSVWLKQSLLVSLHRKLGLFLRFGIDIRHISVFF
jgi:hypothetical protein